MREVSIETRAGIHDLSRVLNVLALLDLTPDVLVTSKRASGLRVRLSLSASEGLVGRCVAKVRELPCVVRADIARAEAAESGGRPRREPS